MWKTQTKYEETVTAYNQSEPTRGSGGIAFITKGTETEIKMVMMPDFEIYREMRKEGQYSYERVFAQIRLSEMDKLDMIPGKTRIEWNGNTYVIHNILDYTSKIMFQNAEIEMRRRLDVD